VFLVSYTNLAILQLYRDQYEQRVVRCLKYSRTRVNDIETLRYINCSRQYKQ